MKRALLACLAMMLLVPAGSSAAPPDGQGPWADSFQDVQQGKRKDGSAVLPQRSDPNQALGVAERTDVEGTFFSLGFGGRMTLGFQNDVCNRAGTDLDIEFVESTREPHPDERVQVFVSEDGQNFVLAATINKDAFVGIPAGISRVKFVKLIDVTPRGPHRADGDGYDVDGVRALETTGCAPQPTGTFSCRASVLNLFGFEPIVANAPASPCVSENKALVFQTFANPSNPTQFASVEAAHAQTVCTPPSPPRPPQPPGTCRGAGTAHAETARVFATSGTSFLEVKVAQADAGVSCVGSNPAFTSSSSVASANLNGNPLAVPPNNTHEHVPLGQLGTIHFNHVETVNGKRTVRAVWFERPDPELDLIVSEAIANFSGNPCPQ